MPSAESLQVKAAMQETLAPYLKGTKQTAIEDMRQLLDGISGLVPMPAGISVEKVTVAGSIPAEWVNGSEAAADKVILYLHGGGYSLGSCESHRDLAARISIASGAKVLLIEYRLAPENPFPAGLDDAVAAYQWLLEQGYKPEKLAISGDSAGGGLALATLVVLRDKGIPLPATAALLSPWTDLASSGESYTTRAAFDPMLSKESIPGTVLAYIGDKDPRDTPLASPLYADLHGLPPMLIQVGRDEILLDDSQLAVAKIRATGGEVRLDIWDDMWHVFQQSAGMMPEGAEAVNQLGEWVYKKMA